MVMRDREGVVYSTERDGLRSEVRIRTVKWRPGNRISGALAATWCLIVKTPCSHGPRCRHA
jgi:hypothetical protein